MENNPTTMATYKLLKITDTNGVNKHVPFNRANKEHFEEHRRNLSRDKQAKYLIEEVMLNAQEAAEVGVAEAHNELHPPMRKGQQSAANMDIVAMLMKQNQDLAERLALLENKKQPKQ
jgi:hypothetical protein